MARTSAYATICINLEDGLRTVRACAKASRFSTSGRIVAMAATTLLTSDQFLAMPEEFDQQGNRIKDELIGCEARSVMIHSSDSVRELKASQSITDPLLPGFSCPLAAFFELT
jgi:hypothetical protein